MRIVYCSGLAALTTLACCAIVHAQYPPDQPSLLPGYPSTQSAYPLHQAGTGVGQPAGYTSPGQFNHQPPQTSGQPGPYQPPQSGPYPQQGQPGWQPSTAGHPSAGYVRQDAAPSHPHAAPNGSVNGAVHPPAGPPAGNAPDPNCGGCNSGSAYQSVVGCGCSGKRGDLVGGLRLSETRGAAARQANWIAGARGLIFRRSYENGIRLSGNDAGQFLFSTDANTNEQGGFEAFIGRRGASGRGWEARYFGLFTDPAEATLAGPGLFTELHGLAYLDLQGVTVRDLYNSANTHRITRDNELHSFESNLLFNAGQLKGLFGNAVNAELLFGFRGLRFEDFFQYAADITVPGVPAQTIYDIEVDNRLSGLQLGGRTEHAVTQRLSLNIGTKFGVYNNRVKTTQYIFDGVSQYAVVNTGFFAGETFFASSSTDQLATVGELDLGFLYEISCRFRLAGGYRLLGISGVGLSTDQIPRDFANLCELCDPDSNGSLFLHGAYLGFDICF